jgi:cytochrome c biogenesis protein CcmG/thiol:disulfide interchange protein DsbE
MAGRKISPLMVLPPILFAALAAMFYFGMQRDDPNSLPSTLIGKQAPPFQPRRCQINLCLMQI